MTIPEQDDNALHALLRLPEVTPLPAAVLESYWRFKRLRDFHNAGPVHPDVLALLVLQTQAPPASEPEAWSVESAIERGELETSGTVRVRWKKKEALATFLEITPRGTALVQLAGEVNPRELQIENVLGVAQ